jgi:hypothetical protein
MTWRALKLQPQSHGKGKKETGGKERAESSRMAGGHASQVKPGLHSAQWLARSLF